jgi:hypothetical protein
MNYQSPLKDFCVVVEQVIETAFTSPGNEILTNNEAATRAALIDPILRKLGWDISDPAMVEVEKRAPSHKNDVVADYVLKNQDGMPVVCVEAKSKGTNLKKCAPKLLQYTNAFKDTVKYALLTDGLVWQFYDCTNMNAHQEFDLASNHFGGAVSFALFMLGKFDAAHYWEPELLPDPLQKIEDLRSDLDSVKKELNSLRKALESPVKPAWSFENSKHAELPFINLNEIEKKMPDTGKPSHFRLPDGEVVAIKTWKAVLLESCKYVLSKVENLQLPLVDKAGKSTLLISEIKPSEKVSFIETSYQDKTVYIYLNYAASRCIANAAYVLQEFLPEGQKALPAVVIA